MASLPNGRRPILRLAWILVAVVIPSAGPLLLPVSLWAAAPAPATAPAPASATNSVASAEAALQQALLAEEAQRDLTAAIAGYEQVVRVVDSQRRLAATAVFRLGECYRKSGRTNDAIVQYRRLLLDFAAEEVLARLSRQNLVALGAPIPQPPAVTGPTAVSYGNATGLPGPATTAAGRAQQVALLEEEIALLDKRLAAARVRFQNGAGDQDSVWTIEREMLQLRRQLVALREVPVRPDILALPPEAPAMPTAELDVLVGRIAEFEQRSPKQPGAVAAFLEVFPDPDLAALQKKIKETESRLSSLQSNTDDNASEISSTESELNQLRSRRQTRWDAVLSEQRERAQSIGRPATVAASASASASGSSPVPTPPVSAADTAEINRLRALIAQSPDLLNAPTGDPAMAPLHRAAAGGQLAVVRFLLDQGADVDNARSLQNWTPLHHAAAKGHKAVVEQLLARGANPNAPDNNSSTPLHQAVSREYREVVRVLLAGGAQVDTHGWLGGTWRQVTRGNIHTSERDTAFTPLHLAAQQGSTNLVTLLLDAGADVNAVNSWQATPLHLAVEARQPTTVALLLAAKADPNRFDSSGQTPLHLALGTSGQATPQIVSIPAARLQPNLVRLLLEAGADPNLAHGSGITPLLLTVNRWRGTTRVGEWRPDTNLITALLAAGADVNRPGTGSAADQLPVYETVANTDLDTTRLLLDAGANPNLTVGQAGETPLHCAVGRRQKAMVELLLARGADPSLRNRAGQTPEDLVNPKPRAATQPDQDPVLLPSVPGVALPGIPPNYPQPGFVSAVPTARRPPGQPPSGAGSASTPAPASDVELAELFRARPSATAATNAPAPPR